MAHVAPSLPPRGIFIHMSYLQLDPTLASHIQPLMPMHREKCLLARNPPHGRGLIPVASFHRQQGDHPPPVRSSGIRPMSIAMA